jgi:hypothetical protein
VGVPGSELERFRATRSPSMKLHIDEGVGCVLCFGADLAFAGSRPYHALPETDGSERSPKDTKATPFESRRALEKPPGHPRTRRRHGSGP